MTTIIDAKTSDAIAVNKECYAEMHNIYNINGLVAFDINWLREHHRSFAFKLSGRKISLDNMAKAFGVLEEAKAHMRQRILADWKLLVDQHGIDALKQTWLEKNKLAKIYLQGKRHGVTLKDAIKELGKEQELKDQRSKIAPNGGVKWNADLFEKTAKDLVEKFGCIPGFDFLKANEYGGFAWQIKNFGPTIEDVRKRHGVTNVTLQSLDGQHFLSAPEVCCANYLLARDIRVEKGDKYPKSFNDNYDRKCAIYDLHFVASEDPYKNRRISVEIWGGAPRDSKGSGRYAETRSFKEEFHKDDDTFLGIEFQDCFTEKKLDTIFMPYIGEKEVIIEHPLMKVPTTMLSFADEVIKECKEICEKLPEGSTLPSMDWFARQNYHKDRPIFDWEPKSWGRLLGRLAKIGYGNVRNALQQPSKHVEWTMDQCFENLKTLIDTYDKVPRDIKKILGNKLKISIKEQTDLSNSKYLNWKWSKLFDFKQNLQEVHQAMKTRQQYRGEQDL